MTFFIHPCWRHYSAKRSITFEKFIPYFLPRKKLFTIQPQPLFRPIQHEYSLLTLLQDSSPTAILARTVELVLLLLFYGGHLRAQSIMFSFLNMKPRILLLCYWKCHPCATVKIVHMMYSSDINGYWLQTNSLGLIFFRCHLTKFNGNVLLFCVIFAATIIANILKH